MALPDTLWADSVLLNGVPYTVANGVQVQGINSFPAKITTGDFTRDDETLLSNHVWNDWSGGLLLKRFDPTTQSNRFTIATVNTHIPRQATAPINFTSNSPALSFLATPVGVIHNNLLFMAFYTSLGGKVRVWNNGGASWSVPAGVADLVSQPLSGVSLRLGTTRWLVFCDSAGYLKWDGTTWTWTNGNGTTQPFATSLVEWDGKLFALEGATSKLWYTTDLSTWTIRDMLPVSPDVGHKVFVYRDANGDPALHAATREGIYVYDFTNDKWYLTDLRWPRHHQGGDGLAIWQGNLCVSAGAALYQLNGSVVRGIGLDQDDGLMTGYQGSVNALVDGFRWLIAGTTPSTASDTGLLLLRDQVGWHVLAQAPSGVNNKLQPILYGSHDGSVSLWFSQGTDLYRMQFPDGSVNPMLNSNYTFRNTSAVLFTPWFDANWPERQKLAVEIEVGMDNADATHTWSLYYAIDDSDTWTTGGMTQVVTTSTSTQQTVSLGSGLGIVFRRLRLLLVLNQGSTAYPPLNVRYLTVRYLKLLPARYAFSMELLAEENEWGYTPEEQADNLQTAYESQTLLPLQVRRDQQELVQRNVRITRLAGSAGTGADTRSRWQVSCAEL